MTDNTMEDVVKSVFLAMQGQEPRPDVLVRWANDISRGSRTIEDLQKYLVRSREYEQHITAIYKRLYTQHIDDRPQPELLKAIFAANTGIPITEATIMDALRKTDAFTGKYVSIIRNLWSIIKDTEIDEGSCNFFLERFREDGYTIEHLQRDIANNTSAPNTAIAYPVRDIAEVLGQGVTIEDYSKVLEIMRSPRLAAELFIASRDITTHPKIKTAVAVFPDFFARDITVVELLRIFPALLATLDVTALVRTEHQRFSTVFNAINQAYLTYTGASIDHMTFINNHLSALDATNLSTVVSDLIDSLTRSDLYKTMVKDMLAALCSVGSLDADADDIEQLFTIVMVSRIGCNADEQMKSIAHDYVAKREAFIKSVGAIYEENLGRPLEADEVRKYRRQYREHKTDLALITQGVQSSFEYIGAMHELVAGLARDLGVDDKFGKSKLYKMIEGLMRDSAGDRSSVTILAKARQLLVA